MAASIYLVGLGLRQDHITPQAEEALRSTKKLFYISHTPEVASLLKEYCQEIVDLIPIAYSASEDRIDAYKKIAATVIDAALSNPPVSFALYGHPLILSHPSSLILRAALPLQIEVSVVPGLSSLDCIFADLGVDPAEHGIQMHEATELLLYQRPLLPDMAAVIWQVGHLETRLYTNQVSRPERLARLNSYLLRFYNESQEIFAVTSSVYPGEASHICQLRLGNLTDYAHYLHAGVTLYIPPAVRRPIADNELYQQLFEKAHLHRITVDPVNREAIS